MLLWNSAYYTICRTLNILYKLTNLPLLSIPVLLIAKFLNIFLHHLCLQEPNSAFQQKHLEVLI